MKFIMAITSLVLLSGCALFHGVPKIKVGGSTVTAPKDNGKPATLATTEAGTSVVLPAGSTVTVTKVEAVPATQTAAAQSAKEITTISPAGPTEYIHKEATVSAQTGTVDTSLASKRIDAEESRPLLYGAILAALAAGVFVYLHYPTPAICCGGASVVFFLAWKMSGLPDWFWALGLAGIAAGVAMYFAHERGLATTALPDKKPPTQ